MRLTFLGCGDSYNYDQGNNAAFFRHDDALFFLDMGQGIFAKALHANLFKGIRDVVIFVTHCHLDHIASLGEAMTYFSVFHPEVSCSIIYPNPEDLQRILGSLYPAKGIAFLPAEEAVVLGVHYRAVAAKHIEHSYAYFLSDEGGSIYYSGDNSELNEEAKQKLLSGEIAFLYQDISYQTSAFHYGLEDLESEIPEGYRGRVIVMHLPDGGLNEKAVSVGFASALSFLM